MITFEPMPEATWPVELTLDDHRCWLQSFPPNQIVGEAACEGACPIANWILQRLNLLPGVVLVGPHTTMIGMDTYQTPEWAENYIRSIDMFDSYDEGINAFYCLRLLA